MVYVLVINGAATAVYAKLADARTDKKRLESKIQNLTITAVPYRMKSALD